MKVEVFEGKNLEEAHMRNRQLIANWVLQHATNNEIEIIEKDKKHFVKINDYPAVRKLYGDLLKEIQRITSEGDYESAKKLVEQYAVFVNKELHKEILTRYKKLNIAPYKGFVNPVYTPFVNDNDEIVNVQISYNEDFISQNIRYSTQYSFLPNVN